MSHPSVTQRGSLPRVSVSREKISSRWKGSWITRRMVRYVLVGAELSCIFFSFFLAGLETGNLKTVIGDSNTPE
ncbi:hypothetical protein CLOM_g8379 [Closterium sp. NIES-68]|nr:hypothetical protein CLOM_g8379 [Closterium sp. NIES-68]